MITWLQTTFGKHHKIALGLLLAVTVISFVFFGAWSGVGGNVRHNVYHGVNRDSDREMQPYRDYVALSGGNIGVEAAIILLRMADTMQIPAPGKEQLQEILNARFGSGSDMRKHYAEFRENVKNYFAREGSVTDAAVDERLERFFNNEWRAKQAQLILAGPGYALPAEAAMRWKQQNTQWTIETATFSGILFNPEIKPSDADLQKYFDTHKDNYLLPPRVAASYVIFAGEKPAANATPEQIRELGDKNAVKVSEILENDLSLENLGTPEKKAEHFAAFLKKHNLTEIAVPEFDKDTVPEKLPVPAPILQQALELSDAAPRTDARILGTDAVVLFLKKMTPARTPELAEVRAKVVSDFSLQEKATLFNAKSAELAAKLRDAVAGGKKFEDAAKTLGLGFKKYPPFLPANRPAEFESAGGAFFDALTKTAAGAVSPQIRIGKDTVILFVEKKAEPTVAVDSPEVQRLIQGIESESAQLNFFGTFQELAGR